MKKSHLKYVVMLMGLCRFAVPVISAQSQEVSEPPRAKQRLFHLNFGRRWEQIGVQLSDNKPNKEYVEQVGPFGLEIKNNRAYIGDRLNGCVKWFSMQGKFLGKTAPLKEYMNDFAVAKNGTVYILTQSSLDSEPLLYKFDSQGKLLWKVGQWDVFSPGWGQDWQSLALLPQGQVGVILQSSKHNQPSESEYKIAVFDLKGRWIYTVPAGHATEDGLFYSFEALGKTYKEKEITRRVRVFRLNADDPALQPATREKVLTAVAKAVITRSKGNGFYVTAPKIGRESLVPVREVTIKVPKKVIPWLYGDGDFYGFEHIMYAPNGALVGLCTAWRKQRNLLEVARDTQGSDVVVLPYSPTGQSTGFIRCDNIPLFGMSKQASVDTQGNIYVLQMTLKGFDVVRYQLKQPQKRQ